MKPDAYMPFYGSDFFEATNGLDDYIVMAYIRILWHYWRHNHCEGFADDSNYLRKIARVDISQWPDCSAVIFGQFFKLDNGLWQQARCKSEWQKTQAIYEVRSEAGKLAMSRRWKRQSSVNE